MTKKDTFEALTKRLIEKYGGDVVMLGKDHPAVQHHLTGLAAIDALSGGYGLPKGRIVEIYGPSGAAKTSVVMRIAQSYASVIWINADYKYDADYATRLGLDQDKVLVIDPENIGMVMNIIKDNISTAVDLIVIDSLPALVSKKELENKDAGGVADVAPLASALNRQLPIFAGRCHASGTTLLLVNQVRDKMNMRNPYQNPFKRPGGRQLESLASMRIILMEGVSLKHDKLGKFGVTIAAMADKSSVSRSWVRSELAYINDVGPVDADEALTHRNQLLIAAGARQASLDKPLLLEEKTDGEILDDAVAERGE